MRYVHVIYFIIIRNVKEAWYILCNECVEKGMLLVKYIVYVWFFLVLLLLDEPRLNVSRLHRIFKNLGYHNDTLLWIVRALISILIRTNQSKDMYNEV